jgi:adenine-specific DNA-methyltransferase
MGQDELGSHEKARGSWYTGSPMAQCLADWALQTPDDRAMDPSFGGGVFFAAAEQRLLALGQSSEAIREQLYGIDLDPAAFELAHALPVAPIPEHLIGSDFFQAEPASLPPMDCIIGNPPYVRYQQWDASSSPAHEIAAAMGYPLTKLASMWAPFVLQMSRFLKQGGRMALVLPAELLYAQYAKPIQRFLREQFSAVHLAVFETAVFPGAQEEVVLLFANGYREGTCELKLHQFHDLASFDVEAMLQGAAVLQPDMPLFALLSSSARAAYEHLLAGSQRVAAIADVDIGIVTGANKFFAVTDDTILQYGLHPDGLVPVLTKAGDVPGATVTAVDRSTATQAGKPTRLLAIRENMSPAVLEHFQTYIAQGEADGVHQGYKCRMRSPWWSLPLLAAPDCFLTYVNGAVPRLAVNQVMARSTNSLHNVRLRDASIDPAAFTVAFYNAGTLLSAELCGRSYGGGALKLEPTEAGRLQLPVFKNSLGVHLPLVDSLVRAGSFDELFDLTDQLVLLPMGLSPADCQELRAAWRWLQTRRTTRATTQQ